MMRIWYLSLVFVGASLPSGSDGGGARLPVFTDVTEQAGIHFKHSYGDFELEQHRRGHGRGAMFFDYDGDGWLDIYFVNGCWLQRGQRQPRAAVCEAS